MQCKTFVCNFWSRVQDCGPKFKKCFWARGGEFCCMEWCLNVYLQSLHSGHPAWKMDVTSVLVEKWSIIYGPLNNAEMWSYSRVEIEFYLNGFTVVTVRPSDGAGGHWAEVFYSFKMITPCCQFQMAERCYK